MVRLVSVCPWLGNIRNIKYSPILNCQAIKQPSSSGVQNGNKKEFLRTLHRMQFIRGAIHFSTASSIPGLYTPYIILIIYTWFSKYIGLMWNDSLSIRSTFERTATTVRTPLGLKLTNNIQPICRYKLLLWWLCWASWGWRGWRHETIWTNKFARGGMGFGWMLQLKTKRVVSEEIDKNIYQSVLDNNHIPVLCELTNAPDSCKSWPENRTQHHARPTREQHHTTANNQQSNPPASVQYSNHPSSVR